MHAECCLIEFVAVVVRRIKIMWFSNSSVRLLVLGAGIVLAAAGAVRGEDANDTLSVRTSGATGVARFVTAADDEAIPVPPARGQQELEPIDFFRAYGELFGITDPDGQLVRQKTVTDALAYTHTTFRQVHEGVPVFAGLVRVHVDAQGQITAVNGTIIPDLKLSTTPVLTFEEAAATALAEVAGQMEKETELTVANNKLYVFRANLARGVPGPNHLVYEVEVGNAAWVREFVYVDAHKGDVVDQITGIYHALDRKIYESLFGPAYLVWWEGQTYPTGDVDIDRQIDYAEDIYNLIASMTNGVFLSWDGGDGTMHSVDNAAWLGCPNASWNGISTNYCADVTGDDTVAHEWGHAYTESTHGLIYQWQPGALNEAYSDIYGEVADLLNGAGTDAPGPLRADGECSTFTIYPPEFEVNSPPAIAGAYLTGGAAFNPAPPVTVTADVELVNDGDDEGGTASVTDACQSLIGFTAGNIALVDRGTCPFVTKTANALAAGAVGVVVANNQGDDVVNMGGDGSYAIPSVMIGQTDGAVIKGELPGVNATITLPSGTDPSLRWLAGEDSTGFSQPIRDMWNPPCLGDPGKVSDTEQYYCGTGDQGGVHTNCGVPTHAFALLVDGGTYNGQTITGIGLTKAFHIYWRAQSVYQVPASDFADHADVLEQCCEDLIGINLYTLSTEVPTGSLSGESISAADCAEVTKAIAAVELRTEPTFCGYTPLLDPNAPPLCGATGAAYAVAGQDWEAGLGAWTVGTRNVADPATFDTPDWAVVGSLPDGRVGSAAFVADLRIGNCADDTEAGVLYLESPVIPLPAGDYVPRVAFDHWVATEMDWDGGNVKINVNGGGWTLVPFGAFDFNPYSSMLNTGDNPMGGEAAFDGTNEGEVTGSWGQSQIDLSGIASPGDNIQLRFEMGLDGCNGLIGWYVDEVQVFYCYQGAFYVDDDAPPGGDGATWATAYKYLQDALTAATAGNEILVADGTYKPDRDEATPEGTGNRSATFQLASGVSLYGGYRGCPGGDCGGNPDERDLEVYETILSGDLNGDDGPDFANNGENTHHVVTGSGTDATTVLDGFAVTGGNANAVSSPDNTGAGIYMLAGSPTVSHCTFTGNTASAFGGGMTTHSSDSSPTVNNCTFTGNTAGVHGAGMLNNGSPAVTDCTFSGNSAGHSGGGMGNVNASPTVTDCTFIGNSATNNGGGMGNINELSLPIVTNCTFSGNTADRGGGMYNYNDAQPTVANCTFSGNSAGSGAGMYNELNSNLTVTNCILWDDLGGEIHNDSSTPIVTYSDVQGGYGGPGNINADPHFLDADGPDDVPGTEDDNLRLPFDSPCVDVGNNTAVTVISDLDGNPRIYDGDSNGTATVDMGAYEYGPDCNANGILDICDTDCGAVGGACDVTGCGESNDCNGNNVPDECEGGVVYVDADAPAGGYGAGWDTACNDLQAALSTAACITVTEIRVAEGTYLPDTSGLSDPREATFQLISGVPVRGGFAGYGAGDPDARDVELYKTILTGDLSGNDVAVVCTQDTPDCDAYGGRCSGGFCIIKQNNEENSYQVVTGSGTDATAVLDGFTITGGNANGPSTDQRGGGLANYSGSPTVTNCTFSGNAAAQGGGMVNFGDYTSGSADPTVSHCTFSGNSASAQGGAMHNWIGSPTVIDCTFSNNSASVGGAMWNRSDSFPDVTECVFTENTATDSGGGMHNEWYGNPTVANCTFTGNSATYGGGMSNYDSSIPTVANCTFNANRALEGGGMCNRVGSDAEVANCQFIENGAHGGYGGGVFNGDSHPTLTNCTFVGQWGGYGGGGMRNENANPTVTNCTFTGNGAAYYGGGISAADGNSVLMHWKLADGGYRVIFEDSRIKTVNADELVKLQAEMLMLQNKGKK